MQGEGRGVRGIYFFKAAWNHESAWNRTRETLVTRLVQEFIQPGTVILSDKFSPYFNLNDIGYTHLMVNHSENFVDPYTGAHTNTIEGVWNAVKKKLKRMCGTFKHQLPTYLDEINWQRLYPGERFEMMLQQSFILCTKLLGLDTTKTVPLGTTK